MKNSLFLDERKGKIVKISDFRNPEKSSKFLDIRGNNAGTGGRTFQTAFQEKVLVINSKAESFIFTSVEEEPARVIGVLDLPGSKQDLIKDFKIINNSILIFLTTRGRIYSYGLKMEENGKIELEKLAESKVMLNKGSYSTSLGVDENSGLLCVGSANRRGCLDKVFILSFERGFEDLAEIEFFEDIPEVYRIDFIDGFSEDFKIISLVCNSHFPNGSKSVNFVSLGFDVERLELKELRHARKVVEGSCCVLKMEKIGRKLYGVCSRGWVYELCYTDTRG